MRVSARRSARARSSSRIRLRRPLATSGIALALLAMALGLAPAASANGVALSSGDVIAGNGRGTYKHFTSSGTLLDTLDTTSGAPEDTGVCFDGNKNMYTTNFASNTMSEFNQAGNLVHGSFGSGFNQDPESCVADQAGNIYVGQADGGHQILKFNSSGTLLKSFTVDTSGQRGTDWIDLAADQCTMHYTGEGSVVKTFNVCTNTQGPVFASGLPAPCYAHRILPDGGEIVACANQVVRLNSSGGVVKTYTPNTNMFAMNRDPDGQTFWVATFPGDVYRINIDTGAQVAHFTTSPAVDVAGLGIVGEITAATPPSPPPPPAPSPPPAAVTPAPVTPTPAPVIVPGRATVNVLGVKTACVSKAFQPRVAIKAPAGVKRVTVFVDGKKVRTSKKSRFTVSVRLGRLKAGRHSLRIVAVDARNRSTTQTRSFFKCAQKAQAKPRPQFTG